MIYEGNHSYNFFFNKILLIIYRLNYLEAVLMEVQRHSNVAPLAIAHRTIRKTSLQEYTIPKV